MEMLIDVILDTLLDAAKLFPFLLLTYIAMELLEHHAGDKSVAWLKKSGKLGPVIGAVTGLFPQCGFSAAASNSTISGLWSDKNRVSLSCEKGMYELITRICGVTKIKSIFSHFSAGILPKLW